MTAVTLVLDIPQRLWISSNRKAANVGHLARVRADLQAIARAAAKDVQPFTNPVHVDWEVRYGKGTTRKADPVNAAGVVTKAALDGIVSAGILRDDSPDFVLSERFWRGANLPQRGHQIVCRITESDF